jgi:hypothetical protein
MEALDRFLETGSRDQAQEAFDCLRAWGLSSRVNNSGQIMHAPCGWTTDVRR